MTDLSLHILDMIRNSVDADSKLTEIFIKADTVENSLTICIKDNGKGMAPAVKERAAEMHFTTRKNGKGGLGIPLFKQAAEAAGGQIEIESEKGQGTVITAVMNLHSPERKPLGSIAETVAVSVMSDPERDLVLTMESGNGRYVFSTPELRRQTGKLPLNDYIIIDYIRKEIHGHTAEIFGGILNEINS